MGQSQASCCKRGDGQMLEDGSGTAFQAPMRQSSTCSCADEEPGPWESALPSNLGSLPTLSSDPGPFASSQGSLAALPSNEGSLLSNAKLTPSVKWRGEEEPWTSRIGGYEVSWPGKSYATPPPRTTFASEKFDMRGWARADLKSTDTNEVLDVASEWDYVFLVVNGWVLEFWPSEREAKSKTRTPKGWYDIRTFTELKASVSVEFQAPGADYALQIQRPSGSFVVRFHTSDEMVSWQQNFHAMLRVAHQSTASHGLASVDKAWIALLQQSNASADKMSGLLNTVFDSIDTHADGRITTIQCARLCVDSYQQRKIRLLEHDPRAHSPQEKSYMLVNIYNERTHSGIFIEVENWLNLCAATPGILTKREFQVLFATCCFPQSILSLEREIWSTPMSAIRPTDHVYREEKSALDVFTKRKGTAAEAQADFHDLMQAPELRGGM
eukprot:gnl/TRDRNA2_/TRDRNA2_135455_c0_seq1.p1 gnl/TRDRNA2_/TRDRNA2_135455_c0~~gnl/TRDRNA2_/TRDRNA2_135455_c0_seq1.p1  ORF type:complete len:467 (-),score=52.26 gnl/TRDRNA2_/TRDRNA2_135455_c0_seq1:17-1339(-)